MSPPALLSAPLLLGLGLSAAGVFLFIVFALPAFVFPEEASAPLPDPQNVPGAPGFQRVDDAARLLHERLTALEGRAVPPPPALTAGLGSLEAELAAVKALVRPLSAAARDHEALRDRVEDLWRRSQTYLNADAPPPPSDRLARRLKVWRAAWSEHLVREEAALSVRRRELESRKAVLQTRIAQERAPLEAERTETAGGLAAASEERGRMQAAATAAAAEKTRVEGEILAVDAKIDAFREEISQLDERRAREEAAAAESHAVLRREAREDQARWRESLDKAAAEAAAARAAEEASLKSLQESGVLETAALRDALRRSREELEKERGLLAAAHAEAAARSDKDSAAASARLDALRAQAGGLEKTRDLLAETLRREVEEHRNEVSTLRAWAADRAFALRALSDKAAAGAASALEKVRAEKALVERALAGEKDAARRDAEALGRDAADGRERFQAELRRAEADHRGRLAALGREEDSLKGTIAALGEQTDDLRARAERLRVKASERLFRRRAAHEKMYAEARQKVEARSAEDEGRLAREKMDIQSLESRLAARRRRMETLRVRRRQALASLLDTAKSALESAVEAQGRTEGLVQERVAALKGRVSAWESLKTRWAEAPRWIEDGTVAGEAGIEASSSAELSGLLNAAERHGEDVRLAFAGNRDALDRAAALLRESESDLGREETGFREVLNAVQAQAGRLDRLKAFFQAVRLPADDAAASEVA